MELATIRIKSTFTLGEVDNVYIIYELTSWLCTEFTIGNDLFAATELTKNDDKDGNGYSGYDIEIDAWWVFSLSNPRGFGKHVIIFGKQNSCHPSTLIPRNEMWTRQF